MKSFQAVFVSLLVSIAAASENLPAELKRLNEARADQIQKIDDVYRSELIKLRDKYRTSGDYESADMVTATLKSIKDGKKDGRPPQENPLEKADVLGRWSWGSGGTLDLKPNGNATHPRWNGSGRWEIDDDGVVQLRRSHLKFEIRFHDGLGEVTCLNDGKRTILKRQ